MPNPPTTTSATITRARRGALAAALAVAVLATLLVATPRPVEAATGPVEVVALSNRADLVSGGDVLVEVRLPDGVDAADVTVDVDGRDVTDAFAVRDDGRFAGLVDGLALGRSAITATLPDGSGATLAVTDHPLAGPVFSGPPIEPWYCLPEALDEDCSRETTFTWQYKQAATGRFAAYDPEAPPADVATTMTDDGVEVPYIVRIETGTMDRSQYRIAVLTTPEEAWDRWTGPVGWNHKVYVPHGAGCGMGHSEGQAPDVLLDIALASGYAVMSTALEHNTENCNVVVQAESVMMAKEHLVETYGDIRFLMGTGCSGGSIAQLHMANAYPGLYDGLTVSCTYPDIPTLDLLDCPAMLRYFTDPTRWSPGVAWTERHMAEAAGLQSFSVCISWLQTFSPMFDPTTGVECDVPAVEPERVYHPIDNPTGVRCSFQDYLGNVYGTRPADRWGEVEQGIGQGFAGRPYDNVGLQYGLRAVMEGSITTEQFIDLNAAVGAVGIDYETLDHRVEADPDALVTAYRSGVMNMANNLDQVPIIDLPIPGDRYEFHDNYKSWALRQRLIDANGHADNHVIWYGPDEEGLDFADGTRTFETMDAWLTAIEADDRDVPLEQKVVDARPEDATDRCDVPDEALCDLVFGSAGNIRWAAGAPTLANAVVKCALKPLDRADYAPLLFTDEQWARLQAAFPDGVCDWTQPGVGQQDAVGWQTYAEGPGGRPLGPPPVSVPFGPAGPAVVRAGGADRVATSVEVSRLTFDRADTVVLAGAGAGPDALVGAPLAARLGGPLLLTGAEGLRADVAAEVQRLGATQAVLLGGSAAIGSGVADDLEAIGVTARRIAGADRVATAVAVAAELMPAGIERAVLVGTDALVDAVAGSGLAAAAGLPILFTTADALPADTADALADASQVTVVGGSAVVGEGVAGALADAGAAVVRLAGADRYATSAAVATAAVEIGAGPPVVWVATGRDVADALAAGAAAAHDRGLLLLVDGRDAAGAPATAEALAALTGIAEVRVAGGPAAVAAPVVTALEELLAGG